MLCDFSTSTVICFLHLFFLLCLFVWWLTRWTRRLWFFHWHRRLFVTLVFSSLFFVCLFVHLINSSSVISPPASSSSSLKRISALSAVSIFLFEKKIRSQRKRQNYSQSSRRWRAIEKGVLPFHNHRGCLFEKRIRSQTKEGVSPFHNHRGCRGSRPPPPSLPMWSSLQSAVGTLKWC